MTIAHPVRKLVMTLAVVALAAPAAASAHPQVSIRLGLPAILPPLVVAEPGVQVVQDFDDEVFFVGGYYWVRRDGTWYRALDHRARWAYVEPRWVPTALVRIPPGTYRHWRAEHRNPDWRQEYPHRGGYQNRWHRHGFQEHGHPAWRQSQEHRRARPEHGGERRGWREARWEPSGHHRPGRGR